MFPNGSGYLNCLKASHGDALPSGDIVITLVPASHIDTDSGQRILKGAPVLIFTEGAP